METYWVSSMCNIQHQRLYCRRDATGLRRSQTPFPFVPDKFARTPHSRRKTEPATERLKNTGRHLNDMRHELSLGDPRSTHYILLVGLTLGTSLSSRMSKLEQMLAGSLPIPNSLKTSRRS